MPALLAWPGEDFACPDCAVAYPDLPVPDAVAMVAALPALTREAVAELPDAALRRRPSADRWSVAEYLCHLRDVHVAYTIRLHRARTEDRPVLEPMLNDLRARRFRYADCDVPAVLGELAAAAAGFADEVRRVPPDGWDRPVVRQPGEERTARWLVRQTAHEGRHHLADVRWVGAAVQE
ncbi:DinB family protein [Modestobacter sp. I12A-02662]|uniref:DinB family protein n=1 Tax=Modestobacter sp. I12A-02662 TaxID=1730496 RepID=UPI0034DF9C82